MGGCDAGMTRVCTSRWTPRSPRGETHPAMVQGTPGSSGGCAQDGAVLPPTRHPALQEHVPEYATCAMLRHVLLGGLW
jgi:hypothetical protein